MWRPERAPPSTRREGGRNPNIKQAGYVFGFCGLEGGEKGVTCYGFWCLEGRRGGVTCYGSGVWREGGKGVTCYGFWGLGKEGGREEKVSHVTVSGGWREGASSQTNTFAQLRSILVAQGRKIVKSYSYALDLSFVAPLVSQCCCLCNATGFVTLLVLQGMRFWN